MRFNRLSSLKSNRLLKIQTKARKALSSAIMALVCFCSFGLPFCAAASSSEASKPSPAKIKNSKPEPVSKKPRAVLKKDKAALDALSRENIKPLATKPIEAKKTEGPDPMGQTGLSKTNFDSEEPFLTKPVINNEKPRFWQCVTFARTQTPIEIYGNAWTWWSQAQGRYETGFSPKPGAALVFRPHGKMQLGHVAVVTEVITDRLIQVTHANWSPINGRRGQVEANVNVLDVSDQGDWSHVKVWYGPSEDLGTKAYPTFGFIYPNRLDAPKITQIASSDSKLSNTAQRPADQETKVELTSAARSVVRLSARSQAESNRALAIALEKSSKPSQSSATSNQAPN